MANDRQSMFSRIPFVVFLITAAAALPLLAQQKNKSLTFQPGSKVPDELQSGQSGTKAPAAAAPAKPAAALDPTKTDYPTDAVAAFFSHLQQGGIDAAYENLTKNSRIAEKPEDMRALKQKTKEAIEVFGAIQGYELVESKKVGTRLLRRTYISLGKEFPLRWRVYFYLSNDAWCLVDLRVDDRLTGLFEEPIEAREGNEAKP